MGSLGLLLTITNYNGAEAAALRAKNSQQIATDIQVLSEALAEQGAYSQVFSESEIQNLLETQVKNLAEKKKTSKKVRVDVIKL
jgi:hypothetical protein